MEYLQFSQNHPINTRSFSFEYSLFSVYIIYQEMWKHEYWTWDCNKKEGGGAIQSTPIILNSQKVETTELHK